MNRPAPQIPVTIAGTGSYLPEKILTNADLAKLVDTTDEWITTRTGIKERRIAAEGEYQASKKLALAANVIEKHPVAVQLRFMQTAVEIAAENNSTTVFPIPMELFGAIARGHGASLTAEEIKTLEAGKDHTSSLPEGTDTQLLAETAKSILGIGSGPGQSGEEKEKVPAEGE